MYLTLSRSYNTDGSLLENRTNCQSASLHSYVLGLSRAGITSQTGNPITYNFASNRNHFTIATSYNTYVIRKPKPLDRM